MGWVKKRKSTKNPKNDDDRCFQYGATIALNCHDIKKDPQRASNIKPFTNIYNGKGINYSLKIED